MSTNVSEIAALGKNWFWFLLLGTLLIITGAVAIGSPFVATVTTVELFGILFLCGAGIEFASAIWGLRWGGFFGHLLCGLLYLFFGVGMIERPLLGAAGFTLALAMFFVAVGLSRVFFAASHRYQGRIWTVLSGLITFALGLMIWRNFPESTIYIIGTFVGIELIFNGFSWVMLGLAARSNRPAS